MGAGKKRKGYYKISDAADLVGLSVNGVRYYEDMGIVRPTYEGTYRYYDLQSLSELLRATNFRQLGFSVEDTQRLTHSSSVAELQEMFLLRYREVERELAEKERLLSTLGDRLRQLNEIDLMEGRCELRKCPGYLIHPQLTWRDGRLEPNPALAKGRGKNVNWGAEAAPSVYIPLESLRSDTREWDAYTGPGISWAKLPAGRDTEEDCACQIHIAPSPSIYTVTRYADGSRLKRDYFDHVFAYARQRGLEFSGSAFTRRIAAVCKGGGSTSFYVQAWFPVRGSGAERADC